MPRRLPLLALLTLLCLGCSACITLPVHSTWAASEPPQNGWDGAWDKAGEGIEGGLKIKAMNTATDLYLSISTDRRDLQSQLGGRFDQSLTFWLGVRPEGHGLRVTFSAEPLNKNPDLPQASSLPRPCVTLLGPSDEGLPRIWAEGTEGVTAESRLSFGTLTWVLKLPLQPKQPGAFALHADPSKELLLSIDTSPLEHESDRPEPEPGSLDTSASSNPALGGIPGMGGGGHRGRRGGHGSAHAYSSSVPTEPLVQEFKLRLAKLPLGGH